jgi:hypothetical protein
MPKGQSGLLMQPRHAEPQLDTLIQVNRSVQSFCPDWVKGFLDPELQNTGPTEYDLAKASCWVHPIQRDEWLRARVIYEHLKSNNMLGSCLGLQDGREILEKGTPVLLKLFGSNLHLYLWRSVVESHDGYKLVPSIIGIGNQLYIHWDWLGDDLNSYRPAVLFPA